MRKAHTKKTNTGQPVKYWLRLITIGVPRKGDLYINKFKRVQRCANTNYSPFAQMRPIVVEEWLIK